MEGSLQEEPVEYGVSMPSPLRSRGGNSCLTLTEFV